MEQTYFRVFQQRMADVPILNPALSVEAIDFQRWQGHWLGIVVTPWCMSVLLVPGSTDNWVWTGENKRRFVRFACNDSSRNPSQCFNPAVYCQRLSPNQF